MYIVFRIGIFLGLKCSLDVCGDGDWATRRVSHVEEGLLVEVPSGRWKILVMSADVKAAPTLHEVGSTELPLQ